MQIVRKPFENESPYISILSADEFINTGLGNREVEPPRESAGSESFDEISERLEPSFRSGWKARSVDSKA